MTDRQKEICRTAVALLLAAIRRDDNITVGTLFDAIELLGVTEENPMHGMKQEELVELLSELRA